MKLRIGARRFFRGDASGTHRAFGAIAVGLLATVGAMSGCSTSVDATAAGAHSAEAHAAPAAFTQETTDANLAQRLAEARATTAVYAHDLTAATTAGYKAITPFMPDMGVHFLNPSISGPFDVTKPPILVYVKHNGSYQLDALEWVFPQTPSEPPLPGAVYGSFPAACHYDDGTFIPMSNDSACKPGDVSPETGAKVFFWHPDLVTMHVWAWLPNPDGLFNSTNPLVSRFSN